MGAVTLLAATATAARCGGDADTALKACTVLAVTQLEPELRESSGVAASRIHDDVVWTHNDSGGEPVVYALSLDGTIRARVRIANGRNVDWEDIATGPCPDEPARSCIFVADIGDNSGSRDDIGTYILPEPDPLQDTEAPARFQALRFADGARDAESLFASPDGRIHIVTKGRGAPIEMFRTQPLGTSPGSARLESMHRMTTGGMEMPDLVTGAALSDDGLVLVRSYARLDLYRLDGDRLRRVDDTAIDLQPLGEPQGEGVAVLRDGTIVLTSEEGPQSVAARLTHLSCDLP